MNFPEKESAAKEYFPQFGPKIHLKPSIYIWNLYPWKSDLKLFDLKKNGQLKTTQLIKLFQTIVKM